MRIVIVLAVGQISAVVHTTCDALGVAVECVAQQGDCPEEKQGRECPPGCPTCHVAHVAFAEPRGSFAPLPRAALLVALPRGLRIDALHDDPEPRGLFRPPRVRA